MNPATGNYLTCKNILYAKYFICKNIFYFQYKRRKYSQLGTQQSHSFSSFLDNSLNNVFEQNWHIPEVNHGNDQSKNRYETQSCSRSCKRKPPQRDSQNRITKSKGINIFKALNIWQSFPLFLPLQKKKVHFFKKFLFYLPSCFLLQIQLHRNVKFGIVAAILKLLWKGL